MSSPAIPKMSSSRWIWPFEILEQIGEGGMGVVYKARYVVNNREVALKMLPGDVTDKIALARFERELEVLKTLRHPNIVRSFGGVCENKRRFYAMELLSGGSLEEQLQSRGRFPWEQVIQYALQMCAALECSHQKGVIHRDVKPSNFLLAPGGTLKLSDFGLASVAASRKITAAGKTAGTFLYMAPEQIRGNDVGPGTDLYAMGCVLYEMITGKVPFMGATAGETLHLHCYSVPDRPTQKAYDCPVQLERIILKLLEKSPEDRYATADLVARDLESVTETFTVVPPRDGRHLEAPAPVEKQRKTPPRPVRAKRSAAVIEIKGRPSSWVVQVLAGVLVLSFLANLMLALRPPAGWEWREQWQAALSSPEPEVRAAAASTFGRVLPRDPRALEPLLAGLSDEDPSVRLASIKALANGGVEAKDSIAHLTRLHKQDESEVVRSAAWNAVTVLQSVPGQPTSKTWEGVVLGIVLTLAAGAGFWYWRQSRQTGRAGRR